MIARTFTALAACGVLLTAGIVPAAADPVEDFYKSKTVRVVVSANPGGGYDVYARLVVGHMMRFLPGQPTAIYQNMQGAGHRIAAGYLYNKAPRDGSVLGVIGQTLPRDQAASEKPVQFDTRAFNWIGNPSEANNIIVTWHTATVKNLQDAMTTEAVIGGGGSSSITTTLPRVVNNVLGTKFRIISGFSGGAALNLAMERGEIDGRGSINWDSLKTTHYEWFRDRKVNFILQMGLRKMKELPDVPLLVDLARNEAERQVFRMLSADVSIGRPVMTTQEVPAERVAALRKAFDDTMKDPEFLAAAEKGRLDINPVSGEELQKIVEEIVMTPRDVAMMMNVAMTKGASFSCADLAKDKKLCAKDKKKKTN